MLSVGVVWRMWSRAVLRAVWCMLAFVPFCRLWGVESFTWFVLVSSLYFVPVHFVFDRIVK